MYDIPTFDKLLGCTPPSENSLIPPEIPLKKVIVHYWAQYNTGKHIFIEIEAGPDFTVLDLMRSIQSEIIRTLEIKPDLSSYVVRIANKEGHPKIDIPVFETSQKVQNLGFVRFALCDALLDQKARKSIEEVNCVTEPEPCPNYTQVKTHSLWKKCFCCDGE